MNHNKEETHNFPCCPYKIYCYCNNPFTKHPNENNMTYWEHLSISMSLSTTFCIGSFQAFIHALFPCFYKTSSSDKITYLNNKISTIHNTI